MRRRACCSSAATDCIRGSARASRGASATRSNPIHALAAVVSATATSTPGHRGSQRRQAQITAIAKVPIATLGRWASGSCRSIAAMSPRKKSPRPMGNPSSLLTCDSPMMMAAAEVKPTMTGCDRKFTTLPSRLRPSASWIAPTRKASRIA
jgi:hypothetical protein